MKPINILKKGLAKLWNQISDQKSKLEADLKANKHISEVDEEWLDNTGNLVDEERVVDILDKASDYERGFGRLGQEEKSIVQKLMQLAGAVSASKKCKCMGFSIFTFSGQQILKPLFYLGPLQHTNTSHEQIKSAPAPKFQKKENATLTQWIEILDWHHANGENQTKTAKHFDAIYPNLQLKQPRISAWCKYEAKWRTEYENSTDHSAKWLCQTEHPEVTEMLDLWVSHAMANNVLLTGEVIHQKWKKFADLVGMPEDEWLHQQNVTFVVGLFGRLWKQLSVYTQSECAEGLGLIKGRSGKTFRQG